MPNLRIGMIGLGVISRYYVEAMSADQDCDLWGVCDIRDDVLKKFQDSEVNTYSDYGELIASDVDAIVINLPNHLHYDVCRAALLSGKHVCCEKPLALGGPAAADLSGLARRHGRVLFTAFHRRYNRNLISAKLHLVGSDRPSHISATYLERIEDHCGGDRWYLDPAKCGGGCVADNGPNVFDTLIELFGPVGVRAANIIRDDRGIDMQARVELSSHDGIPITVDLDWAYGHGESKSVAVEWSDGRRLDIDMLKGFPAFKSSLTHEYSGVLADFTRHIRAGILCDRGHDVAQLVDAVYAITSAHPGGEARG